MSLIKTQYEFAFITLGCGPIVLIYCLFKVSLVLAVLYGSHLIYSLYRAWKLTKRIEL